jgi:hypothetical protein
LKWPPETGPNAGAGDDGQSEGDRNAEQPDAQFGKGSGEHGAAAATEGEPEGAEEFGGPDLEIAWDGRLSIQLQEKGVGEEEGRVPVGRSARVS